jgi:hypothetical protein
MKFKVNQRVILTKLNNMPATIIKYAGGGCCGADRRWWCKIDSSGQRVMILEKHIKAAKGG